MRSVSLLFFEIVIIWGKVLNYLILVCQTYNLFWYLVPQFESFYLRCWFMLWPPRFCTDCCCDNAHNSYHVLIIVITSMKPLTLKWAIIHILCDGASQLHVSVLVNLCSEVTSHCAWNRCFCGKGGGMADTSVAFKYFSYIFQYVQISEITFVCGENGFCKCSLTLL